MHLSHVGLPGVTSMPISIVPRIVLGVVNPLAVPKYVNGLLVSFIPVHDLYTEAVKRKVSFEICFQVISAPSI